MSKEGAGATPASVGIKLAERLQEVASQLAMQPAPSSEPGSLMNTPRQQLGGAAGQPVLTPRKFEFAADVAAMLQVTQTSTMLTLPPYGAEALHCGCLHCAYGECWHCCDRAQHGKKSSTPPSMALGLLYTGSPSI